MVLGEECRKKSRSLLEMDDDSSSFASASASDDLDYSHLVSIRCETCKRLFLLVKEGNENKRHARLLKRAMASLNMKCVICSRRNDCWLDQYNIIMEDYGTYEKASMVLQ